MSLRSSFRKRHGPSINEQRDYPEGRPGSAEAASATRPYMESPTPARPKIVDPVYRREGRTAPQVAPQGTRAKRRAGAQAQAQEQMPRKQSKDILMGTGQTPQAGKPKQGVWQAGTVGDSGRPTRTPLDSFKGGEHAHATSRHSGYGPHGGPVGGQGRLHGHMGPGGETHEHDYGEHGGVKISPPQPMKPPSQPGPGQSGGRSAFDDEHKRKFGYARKAVSQSVVSPRPAPKRVPSRVYGGGPGGGPPGSPKTETKRQWWERTKPSNAQKAVSLAMKAVQGGGDPVPVKERIKGRFR